MNRVLAQHQDSTRNTSEVSESQRTTARQAPSTSRTYDVECIFCQKTKYVEGLKTRESLVQCQELRADDKIRKAAAQKMDRRILALVSRDVVAAEGRYHRSRYRSYTCIKDDVSPENSDIITTYHSDEHDQYKAAENESFAELFQYIQNKLFSNPRAIFLFEIKGRIITCMHSKGIPDVQKATTKHIQRKLKKEFGNSLHFMICKPKRILIYLDNVKVADVLKENYLLKQELECLNRVLDRKNVLDAAIGIRDDIQNQEIAQTWPPQARTEEESPIIPSSLAEFLRYLLTGSCGPDDGQIPLKTTRLLQSFVQDLVYAVTCGRIKPSKHIALPFNIKSLTGNVGLMHTLNRLGHCISYSLMQEIDTALCVQKLSTTSSSRQLTFCSSIHSTTISSSIVPEVFTILHGITLIARRKLKVVKECCTELTKLLCKKGLPMLFPFNSA